MISILINSLTEGGAEKVVLTLLDLFVSKHQKVELICLEKKNYYEVPKEIKLTYLSNSSEPKNGVTKFLSLIIAAWKLKQHVNKNKVELVQSHLIRSCYVNSIAQMLGSRHKSQGVIHMIIGDDTKGRLNHYLIKFLFARLDQIVSISEMVKIHWNQKFKFKNSHIVISNPHKIDNIQRRSKEVPENFKFQADRSYLIFIGRLVPLKRVAEIIDVFADLKGVFQSLDLIILGDGEEKENLVKLVNNYGLAEFVHFIGQVRNPYMFIKSSDLLVLNSETEGLPNVLIESMACGTPIVSSDCISGPREILQPESDPQVLVSNSIEIADYGILTPVGNRDLLKDAITIFLKDEKLRNQYHYKLLERAWTYDAEKIVCDYIKAIDDLIN